MQNLAAQLNFLKADQIKTDTDSLKNYGKDWTTYYDVDPLAIVFPQTADEVVKLVKFAIAHHVALVPSGGRTGLSGAAVATQKEIVVSFERMNRIVSYNKTDQTVVCEPGVITEALQKFAHDKGLLYPVDFAAKGSSHIGGNIATNAGGIKVLRYGLTRNWVTGLKVVTGTGELLDLNKNLIKNATGYDLRHLFIGSEGTLGFIVEATMQLSPQPREQKVFLMAVPDLDSIMKVFSEFKKHTTLSAFEMLSDKALKHVLASTELPQPFQQSAPYYIVAEVELASAEQEEVALTAFSHCVENSYVLDGVLSQSEAQAKTFWRYREQISESLSKFSPYKNDVSVSIAQVPHFMKDLEKVLANAYPTWEVVWFGHVGDGNLHINILRPSDMSKEEFVQACRKVDELVFQAVERYQGSISAEHGVGLSKKSFLHYSRSAAEIEILKQIKKIFDPHQIINPGKIV